MSAPWLFTPPVVSPALRSLPKKHEIGCTLRLFGCREAPEYTVLAHLRGKWALGMARKPHDSFGVYSCDRCHDALDGRNAMTAPTEFDVLRALYESQSIMIYFGALLTKEGPQ